MSEGIDLSVEGQVGIVTLDRPPVNAFRTSGYRRLAEVFQEVAGRSDVHAVVLCSANPKVFSAGADVKELSSIVGGDAGLDEQRQLAARELYEAVLDNAQPTVAAIGGVALGAGAVLAACCDVRYASESARIGLPEINVARCGGGRHLMRLNIPQGKLREMYFTGEPLGAREALDAGLVDRVFADGTELEEARALAERIASKSPLALRLAKESLNACEELGVREGYAVEQSYTLRLGRTEDAREASAAFLEKRDPVWKGR